MIPLRLVNKCSRPMLSILNEIILQNELQTLIQMRQMYYMLRNLGIIERINQQKHENKQTYLFQHYYMTLFFNGIKSLSRGKQLGQNTHPLSNFKAVSGVAAKEVFEDYLLYSKRDTR